LKKSRKNPKAGDVVEDKIEKTAKVATAIVERVAGIV